MTPKHQEWYTSLFLFLLLSSQRRKTIFFCLFKAIWFLNLKNNSPAFVKPQQGKKLHLMLNVRETYKYLANKLNTRIFELSLPNSYLSSYLNAGYKQVFLTTVPVFLFCFQFSCVFSFLTMFSSSAPMKKIYTNDQEAC